MTRCSRYASSCWILFFFPFLFFPHFDRAGRGMAFEFGGFLGIDRGRALEGSVGTEKGYSGSAVG